MTTEHIFQALGAIGGLGGLASLVGLIVTRRQRQADYAARISETAMTLITPLEKRISAQDKVLERQARQQTRYLKRITYLMGGIEALTGQLVQAQQTPCWRPEPWEPEPEQPDEEERP